MRIAVVGAGISGLVLARALVDGGVVVRVFEKGRGVGGRVATRRQEQGAFDHGAQRFSARGDAFRAQVALWARDGLVLPTEPASNEPWWLPVASASHLPEALALGLDIRASSRVMGLRRHQHAWRLAIEGAAEEGPFDHVLLTAPAPQCASLLAPRRAFTDELARVRYEPTWALMLACDAASADWPELIFTELREGPIALIVSEGRKPARLRDDALVRLTVHASSAFSLAHIEEGQDVVAELLLRALRQHPGLARLRARFAQAQRWRYARVATPLGVDALFDRERGLGVAGDGMLGPRIEAAWQSGRALAAKILEKTPPEEKPEPAS